MYSAMLRGLQQHTLAYDRGFAHFVYEYQIEFWISNWVSGFRFNFLVFRFLLMRLLWVLGMDFWVSVLIFGF